MPLWRDVQLRVGVRVGVTDAGVEHGHVDGGQVGQRRPAPGRRLGADAADARRHALRSREDGPCHGDRGNARITAQRHGLPSRQSRGKALEHVVIRGGGAHASRSGEAAASALTARTREFSAAATAGEAVVPTSAPRTNAGARPRSVTT